MSFVPLNMAIEFDGQVHNPAATNGPLVAADSTPTWAVFEQGNTTAVYTGNMTARATTGVYFMAGTASGANGFNVGKMYQAKMTAIVGGVTDITVLARFILVPAFAVTGVMKTDASYFAGQTITAGAGVTLPSSVASPTNITAGTLTLVTTATNLTTNNDKTGYALTSGERTSVADALLDRDMSIGTDSGSPTVRTVRQALRFLRNKWSISGGAITVTKENDTTASWTGTVTTTAGNPVSTIDPT